MVIYANAIHAEENDSCWKGRGGGRRIKMNQPIGPVLGKHSTLDHIPSQLILKTVLLIINGYRSGIKINNVFFLGPAHAGYLFDL